MQMGTDIFLESMVEKVGPGYSPDVILSTSGIGFAQCWESGFDLSFFFFFS